MNKYNIILADCPWDYFNPKQYKPSMGGVPYSTLSIDELKSIPVQEIADKNCTLFFWATFPKLPEAFEIIKSWGFEFVTNAFTWLKTYKNGNLVMGLGHYTRGNAELCLLAKRGNVRRLDTATNVSQVIVAPRTKHSQKPAEVKGRIVELLGDLPRIELFARERTPGWDSLGNELDGLNIHQSIYLINVCNHIKLNGKEGQ